MGLFQDYGYGYVTIWLMVPGYVRSRVARKFNGQELKRGSPWLHSQERETRFVCFVTPFFFPLSKTRPMNGGSHAYYWYSHLN